MTGCSMAGQWQQHVQRGLIGTAGLTWDVGRPCSSRSANVTLPTRFWGIEPLVQHQSPEALLMSRFHSVIPSAECQMSQHM